MQSKTIKNHSSRNNKKGQAIRVTGVPLNPFGKSVSGKTTFINPVHPQLNGSFTKSVQPFRRGQAAMEFLMTYGWAILVVLIAVAALYALGVFSGGGGTSCKVDAPFACVDVQVLSTGASQMVLTSQGAVSTTVSATPGDQIGDCTLAAGAGITTTPMLLTCSPVPVKGQNVKGTFTLSYKLQTSPLLKTAKGSWSTTVQ